MKIPKVFISYSWTSDEYAERVVEFVQDLRSAGIEVVFDRLDLAEGQDKHQFMERAVTDATVDRVLILCDPVYADKADGRRGGVGTETLIISPKVYASAEEERFIPVIMERDGDQVRVPTYLDGRIYVDLTGPDRIVQFQRLVRRVHGKPELVRTPLGPPPPYLEERRPELRTGRSLDIFKDTVERERGHQTVRLEEYLDRLSSVLAEETTPPDEPPAIADEWAVSTIERLRGYRDEFADLLSFIARYDEVQKFSGSLHTFFEALLTARRQRIARHYGDESEGTPLAFMTWELFLIAVASLLGRERFGHVTMLFQPYHSPGYRDYGTTALQSYEHLDPGFRLIDEIRANRLGLRRSSLSADLVHERAAEQTPSFEALMQADVVCWLRSVLSTEPRTWGWYPRLLAHGRNIETLPLFVRAARATVFERLAPVIGVPDHATLLERWSAVADGVFSGPESFWGGRRRYEALIQLEHLGTRT